MKNTVIGIDVGGTNIKLGLVDSNGKIRSRRRLVTKEYSRDKALLISKMIDEIKLIMRENRQSPSIILGIGIGVPGLINLEKGIVSSLTNIPGWKNVPLASILKKSLRIPVYIDNDVNLITLAEWKFGVGKGLENLICITLGTGVGGGLILNNGMYRGEGFAAGEIGHVPYGKKDLEYFVGNKSIKKLAASVFNKKDISIEDLFQLSKDGNKKALKIWKDVGSAIGVTLAGVANVLNPRLIIIGGGVSNNYRFLRKPILDAIKSNTMPVQLKMLKVVRASLGDDAGILGAKILVEEMTSQKK